MKHRVASALTSSVLAMLAVATVSACNNDPVGDKPKATVAEPSTTTPAATPAAPTPAAPATPVAPGMTRYSFSQDGSKISFVGAKVTGKHDGGFEKFTGFVDAAPGKPETAKLDVTIDMASVWTDAPKLTGHLKSADFFDVANIPTARFVSTKVEPNGANATVTGDLTLHGVTKSITFPATVTTTDDAVTAKAEFGLNRKDFGIVYPGKPDDLIKDEVLLKLDIHAKR